MRIVDPPLSPSALPPPWGPPAPGAVIDELVAPWMGSGVHSVGRLRRLAALAWYVAGLAPDRQPQALAAVDLGAEGPIEDRYTLLGVFARMVAKASTCPCPPLQTPPGSDR